LIVQAKVTCLFTEPQISPRLIKTVLEGSGARVGRLDALGVDLPPRSPGGGDMYLALLRQLATGYQGCLGGS